MGNPTNNIRLEEPMNLSARFISGIRLNTVNDFIPINITTIHSILKSINPAVPNTLDTALIA